jgi:Uma2 family endonuclease
MNAAVEAPKRVWTEAELEGLPDDGYIHEVVDGELVMSPKNNFQHGDICARLILSLGQFVRQHKLGVVCDSSTGFWMHNLNCRAPDVSFVSKERLQGKKRPDKAFFRGAPDLAEEILGGHWTHREINDRLKDFFSSGTRLAWIINPDEEWAEVCHSPADRRLSGRVACSTGKTSCRAFN